MHITMYNGIRFIIFGYLVDTLIANNIQIINRYFLWKISCQTVKIINFVSIKININTIKSKNDETV